MARDSFASPKAWPGIEKSRRGAPQGAASSPGRQLPKGSRLTGGAMRCSTPSRRRMAASLGAARAVTRAGGALAIRSFRARRSASPESITASRAIGARIEESETVVVMDCSPRARRASLE